MIRKGQEDRIIYINVRDFFDLFVRGLERGFDSVSPKNIESLLADETFGRDLSLTVTSREIQYRVQGRFIQVRLSLIQHGVPETALPLTSELQARLEEDSRAGSVSQSTAPQETQTTLSVKQTLPSRRE